MENNPLAKMNSVKLKMEYPVYQVQIVKNIRLREHLKHLWEALKFIFKIRQDRKWLYTVVCCIQKRYQLKLNFSLWPSHQCFFSSLFQKPPSSDTELLQLIQSLPNQNMWAIIMLGGGHFAAAIYQGKLKPCQSVNQLGLMVHLM